MTLADLIHGRLKNEPVGAATATVATFATEGVENGGTVARVATVAVASPGSEKSDGADPTALWWRVSILEPGGRAIEVDTPSGFTLPDWEAYAERYHGLGCTVTPIAGLPKPRAPVPLGEALAAACEGLAGITPESWKPYSRPRSARSVISFSSAE